jgi:hypothetical protein
MKQNTKTTLLTVGMSVWALSALWAKPPGAGNHGTDIVHLFATTTMVNEGIETNAAGTVAVNRNAQGHADNQFLSIDVSGLTPDSTYDLLALVGDDTGLTDVAQFTTDDSGNATVQYSSKANGNGNGHGHGHGHGQNATLPDALNPISSIQAIDVGTITTLDNILFTTNIVLSADLTSSDKLEYLIKRDMGTNGVSAELRIKATADKSQFRLTASGLDASTDYLLAFNGDVVQTNTTDDHGRLSITAAPVPAEILQLRSVAVLDTSSNVVVSTSLP